MIDGDAANGIIGDPKRDAAYVIVSVDGGKFNVNNTSKPSTGMESREGHKMAQNIITNQRR